ncbi:MAG: DAK2 domain-containing protein [Tissierellia bacterium]|nr:DAK2 domain-containing protein [Tissierellia bacterium]
MVRNKNIAKKFKEVLTGGNEFLQKNKEYVNDLNIFPVPDGDTGTNMSLTVKSALDMALKDTSDDIVSIAKSFSKGSLMGARGNSGVILSQLFRGFAESLDPDLEIFDEKAIAKGFKSAVKTAYKAVMRPTEGTILTVSKDIANFADKHASKSTDRIAFLEGCLKAGQKSLDNTPNLLPVLKEAGVVDAGGQGLLCILEGCILVLRGKLDLSSFEAKTVEDRIEKEHEHISTDDIKFGYCTEFMIETKNANEKTIDNLRNYYSEIGDSLIVVGTDEIIKVHVHTNEPGNALQKALEIGSLKDIKIDNMRIQHRELIFDLDEYGIGKENNNEKKKYGFIAVSVGEGFDKIFNDINVDYIVQGGQTMNPSTEDILKGVEKTNAENIFILPNNGNIILAAQQAKEASDRNLFVIPTRSVPQGITAILNFDETEDVKENFENMSEAINNSKDGEVTYAVRATKYGDKNINEGEIIGISGKEIYAQGNDTKEVVVELIEKLVDEDSSFISIYYGEDTSDEDAEAVEKIISEKFDYCDVQILYGGQPLYYYIVSIE